MGCCLTTTATAAAAAADDDMKIVQTRDTSPPLPPGSGEETVKEVLSETPSKFTGGNTPSFNSDQQFRYKHDVVQVTKNQFKENASEVSSEIYTYSAASRSTVTTTTIGTGVEADDDGEVTQKVSKPPPLKLVSRRPPVTCSGDLAGRRERGFRPPSTARRQLTSRTVRTGQRSRNVVSSNVVGRESPARRSRSPAVKEKSPVVNSGKRVPVKVRENEVNVRLKKTSDVSIMPVPETCELLDNPLVSLECFIFL